MIRVYLIIMGLVQGVYFRQQAKEKADQFRLTGWVANEVDGTVSLTIEGEENRVNALIEWCHGGPSTARVDKVVIAKEPYMAEFDSFDIRY